MEVSSTSSTTPASSSTYSQRLTSYLGTSESQHVDPEAEVDPKANLSKEEKNGLYALLGILLGGWVLGGVVKKDGLTKREHHTHKEEHGPGKH